MNTNSISDFVYYLAKGENVIPLNAEQESIKYEFTHFVNYINTFKDDYYRFYRETFYPSSKEARHQLKTLADLLSGETLILNVEPHIRTIMTSVWGKPMTPSVDNRVMETEPNNLDLNRYVDAVKSLAVRKDAYPCFRLKADLAFFLAPEGSQLLSVDDLDQYFLSLERCFLNHGPDETILDAWNQLGDMSSLYHARSRVMEKLLKARMDRYKLSLVQSSPSTQQQYLINLWHYQNSENVVARMDKMNLLINELENSLVVMEKRVTFRNRLVTHLAKLTTQMLNSGIPLIGKEAVIYSPYTQSIGGELIISRPTMASQLGESLTDLEDGEEEVLEEQEESPPPRREGPLSPEKVAKLREKVSQLNLHTPVEILNPLVKEAKETLGLEYVPPITATPGEKLEFLFTLNYA